LADRQPSESIKLPEWGLRILTEKEKRERENANPLLAEGGQRLRKSYKKKGEASPATFGRLRIN